VVDRWQWRLDLVKKYSVSGVYHFFVTVESPVKSFVMVNIWHKGGSLEGLGFCVASLRNRLSTKDNLIRGGIIQANYNLCVSGSGMDENGDHMFLWCPNLGKICFLIRNWMGIHSGDSTRLSDHLLQFVHLGDYT